MPRPHPRCELCQDNPPDQVHCWAIFPDDDEEFDDGAYDPGEPAPESEQLIAQCRHCNATAAVCPTCDGDGKAYGASPGEDRDCPTCEGRGVLPPGKGSESSR